MVQRGTRRGLGSTEFDISDKGLSGLPIFGVLGGESSNVALIITGGSAGRPLETSASSTLAIACIVSAPSTA